MKKITFTLTDEDIKRTEENFNKEINSENFAKLMEYLAKR